MLRLVADDQLRKTFYMATYEGVRAMEEGMIRLRMWRCIFCGKFDGSGQNAPLVRFFFLFSFLFL